MKKWMTKTVAAAAVLALLGLSACGASGSRTDFETSALQVLKDGTIRGTEVEVLDKSTYSFEELKTMAEEMVDAYNKKGKGQITLETLELIDEAAGSVRMVLDYESAEDYIAFQTPITYSTVLFFGTVSEAMEQGYEMVNMWEADPSIQDPVLMTSQEIEAMGEKKLLITSETGQLYVPGKIAYIGDNAALTVADNQKQAMLVDSSTGLFYLLLK